MKSKLMSGLLTGVILGLILSFQNCSDIKLSGIKQASLNEAGLRIEHCSEKARTLDSKLKFIFIMDRSHSNQCRDGADVNCEYGTDPMGDRRFPPILSLIQQYRTDGQNDDLIFWSLINFSDNSQTVRPFTNDSLTFRNFIGVRADVASATGVDPGQYGNTGQIDNGSTNYLRALDSAKKLIQDDITAAKALSETVSSTYVIFFISDGEPNELSGNIFVPQDPALINSSVETMVNLGSDDRVYVDGIQFNTAFYYEEFNATARSLLTSMAVKGRGAYAEFGAGEGIDFNRFRIPSRQLRFDLKELWVLNNNTIWKENRLLIDTDGDYLSDEDEIRLKSEPYNPDSDGNGVRDGIELKILGIPCQSLLSGNRCLPTLPPLICSALVMSGGGFDDKDKDKLNSCEETLLGTLPNNFDSNNDSVPDSVGLRFDYPIIKNASNELYLDRDSDNVTNYRELKDGSNYKIPNSQIPNFQKMSYSTTKISEDSQFSCYAYTVKDLAIIGNVNQLTAFALEGTQFISQKLELRSVTKDISPGYGVIIQSSEFD